MRRSVRTLLFAAVLGGAAAALQVLFAPCRGIDSAIHDLAIAARPPIGATTTSAADPRDVITIVAIDERTLGVLGSYNGGYPRSYHAQLLEQLLAAPPRVVAYDLGFFEPTPDDAVFVSALQHARSVAVPTSVILSAAGVSEAQQGGRTSNGPPLVYDRALLPVPSLAQVSDVAMANVLPDDRGTIRSMPLLMQTQGVERPSLGLAAAAHYLRRPSPVDGRSEGSLSLAGRAIPINRALETSINFFGPPSAPYAANSTFRVVSFVDVLRGQVDPNTWRGGLVFVGALGATGLGDDYWTPASDHGRKMAGVEIHANVAATILSSQFVTDMPPPQEVGLIMAVALLIGLICARTGLFAATLSLPLVLGPVVAGLGWLLYANGTLAPVAMPTLSGLAVFVVQLVPRLADEHRQARKMRDELEREQRYDRLTGLSNRTQLTNDLHGLLVDAAQYGRSLAVVVVDIQRLRDVNDALGHHAGDILLRAVADRLRGAAKTSRARLARMGGGEFGLLLPDADVASATDFCSEIARFFDAPIPLTPDAQPQAVTVRFGIAVYPTDAADPETLLRRADVALNAARGDRVPSAVYQNDQDMSSAQRLRLVNDLRQAFTRNELSLSYQPKIECVTGRLAGVEALIRWRHPTDGFIAPDVFVPLAEQTGVISQLTRWVLREGVRQTRAWLDAGVTVRMAMNLSAHDLRDVGLPRLLGDTLDAYDVAGPLISLEITESALLADPDRAFDVLSLLDAQGVHACLDDFGTGYSSLTYLRRLPLQELKVDASFVRGMLHSAADRAIVQSTVELAHRLGLTVVAEGVEDEQTLRELAALGCDQAQGFHVSRPLAGDTVPAWARGRQATLGAVPLQPAA